MENDGLTKAEQAADLLCEHLCEAHRAADDNPAMEMVLLELLDDARRIHRKLKGLQR